MKNRLTKKSITIVLMNILGLYACLQPTLGFSSTPNKVAIMGLLGDSLSGLEIIQGGGGISSVSGIFFNTLCCSSGGAGCVNGTNGTTMGFFANGTINVSGGVFVGQNYLYNMLGNAMVANGFNLSTGPCSHVSTFCTGLGGGGNYAQLCATNSAASSSSQYGAHGCVFLNMATGCTDNNGTTGGTWNPGSVTLNTTA